MAAPAYKLIHRRDIDHIIRHLRDLRAECRGQIPGAKARVKGLRNVLAGLRRCHILQRANHELHRERSFAVNGLLIGLL